MVNKKSAELKKKKKSAELKKKRKKLKDIKKKIEKGKKTVKKEIGILKKLGIAALALGASIGGIYAYDKKKKKDYDKYLDDVVKKYRKVAWEDREFNLRDDVIDSRHYTL
jgi:hypothetical protein